MSNAKSFAMLVCAMVVHLGYLSESVVAQSPYGSQGVRDHSDSCAGGCNHGGGNEPLEIIPYSNAARQEAQAQRAAQYYRGEQAGRMSYDRNDLRRPSEYRSSYQGNYQHPDAGPSRTNYRMGREDFGYDNDPAASFSGRKHHGHPGCRGGCSYEHRGAAGHGRGTYEGDNFRPDAGRDLPYGNEADIPPQLNRELLRRENQAAGYRRSSTSEWNR